MLDLLVNHSNLTNLTNHILMMSQSAYVFRFPSEIEKLIQIYALGYGTNTCRIFRDVFSQLSPDETCWRLFINIHEHIKCITRNSYAKAELQIARFDHPKYDHLDIKPRLIKTTNEFLQRSVVAKFHMLTSQPQFGTPCAIIIRNELTRQTNVKQNNSTRAFLEGMWFFPIC